MAFKKRYFSVDTRITIREHDRYTRYIYTGRIFSELVRDDGVYNRLSYKGKYALLRIAVLLVLDHHMPGIIKAS